MTRKEYFNIAVVAGGYSGEHEISLLSAANLMRVLATQPRIKPYLVILERQGWSLSLDDKQYPVDKNDFTATLPEGEKLHFDYAFITIHGTPGENGLLQGYFDMLQIPYNTGGVFTEALTFSKYHCNRYLTGLGFRTTQGVRTEKEEPIIDAAALVARYGLPLFVKPNAGGSSLATTKVSCQNELQAAVECAFSADNAVLIEQFVAGREVTCGCVVTREQCLCLPLSEVVVPSNTFFDYKAKYYGASREITPAQIDPAIAEEIQRITRSVARKIDAHGIIRIDYIIPNDGKPVLLEVNTTPGMTDASFIPQQAAAAGLDLGSLLSSIIKDSLPL